MSIQIQIIDTQTSALRNKIVSDGSTTLSPQPGDIIQITESTRHAASYMQDGTDLVITFDDGTELRIQNYFNCGSGTCNEIVFIDKLTSEAWRALPEESAMSLSPSAEATSISFYYEPLVAAETQSMGYGWILPALLLGGAGVAAAASGSSGGGKGKSRTPRDNYDFDTRSPNLDSVSDNVAPVIGRINAGDTTNDNRPVITGTSAAPGLQVNIYDNGVLIGSAPVDAAGHWSFTPGADLAEGAHNLTFRNAKSSGEEGPVSAGFTFSVDTVAPTTTPVLDNVHDDIAPIIGTITAGDTTNDKRPEFTGNGAEPDTHINVYNNGILIGTTTTDGIGEWSFTPGTDLSDGAHSFTFRNADLAGNEGPASAPFEFSVDTIAPTTVPILGSVTDNVLPVVGAITAGDTTNDPRPSFNGSGGVPNALVNVYNDGVLVGTTSANGAGVWSFTPSVDLAEGAHNFTFRNTDFAGNEGPSSADFSFSVDTIVPTTIPVLDSVTDNIEPVTGAISAGDTTNDPRPVFEGSGAEPDTLVNIYNNGVLVATVTVDGGGDWAYTPGTNLAEGAHNFTFRNADHAGNEGPSSAGFAFSVLTVVPGSAPVLDSVTDNIAPVTGAITANSTTNDPRPVFAGSDADPDESVRIYDNGILVATVSADNNGDWSFTPGTDLAEGSHSFTFHKLDSASNEGPSSASFTFLIDTVVPTHMPILGDVIDNIAPVIGVIHDGDTTNDPRPTFNGADAEPNTRVNIYDNGVLVGTTTVNGAGVWSYVPGTDLAEGSHSFTFRSTDLAGNEGPASANFDFSVDTIIPTTMPVLDSVTDNIAPVTGAINAGDTTNDPRPVFEGSGAEPDTLVRIYDNGALVATVSADNNGEWSYTPDTDLAEGNHSFTFLNVDYSGNEGPISAAFPFLVDTIVPTHVPSLGEVIDNIAPVTGAISAGDTTNDPRPEFRGNGAEPNTLVNIYDNGVLIGSANVNSSGGWSFTPNSNLSEGDHSFTFRNADYAGHEGPSSPAFEFSVDTVVPGNAPVLVSVTDNVTPVTGAINAGDTTNDLRPVFEGSGAEPDTLVNIYEKGNLVATVAVDGDGDWSYTPSADLAEGSHSFTFRNADHAGNEGPASAAFAFSVDTIAPTDAPILGAVIDKVIPVTGSISDGDATNDPRPSFNGGGAEPGTWVNIYDDGNLIDSVPVDGNGNWSYTPGFDFDEGDHSITFRNADAAGNEGPPSAPFDFSVDTVAPTDAPTLGGVTDNVEPVTGAISPGGITNDPRPEFTGSGAEPGSTINVYNKGSLVEIITVDGAGNWSYRPGANLDEGNHSFTFRNQDAAGNEGPASVPFDFSVDTSVPSNTVTIDSITPDTGASSSDFVTNATSVTLYGHTGGTLGSGAKLQISLDGGASWIDVTPTGTSWSYTDSRTLSDGAVEYQTRILSAANTSGPITTQTITIDTEAPATITGTHIEDDTGISATDFITSDTSLTIYGTLGDVLGAGERAQISTNGGTTWQDVSVSGTDWSFVDNRTLTHGDYTYKIRTIDIAGNITNGTDIGVTVDTVAPGAITITSIADDTGDSATDFLTSDQTITLHGSLAVVLGADEEAQISFDSGTTWEVITNIAGTSWNHADPRILADGDYTYMVRIMDAAGNIGPVSSQIVTIDTAMPGMLVVTRIQDSINPVLDDIIDGTITNDASPIMTGTAAEPYSIVRVYNGDLASRVLIGEVRADAAGNWTFAPSAPLEDGLYAWSVSNVDAAGNEGNRTAPIHFEVDTILPTDSNIVALTGDSGASATDFIINNGTIELTGTFTLPINPGEIVNISADGGLSWDEVTDITGTDWRYLDPVTRTDGTYYYEIYVHDGAGNVGASDTQKVVVDTTDPGAITIDSIGNDTGISATDFITSATSITLNGTLAAPLALGDNKETAQISFDNGATWTNLVVNGTSWSHTDPTIRAHGAHEYQVRIIDLAGNTGPVASQVVTVDTVAPEAPSITAIDEDTGIVSDFITSDTEITIEGTLAGALEAGDRVQISVDNGATWGDAAVSGTNWSFVDGRTLTDGSHVYQVRTIDIAGNITVGASQTVVVKTSASSATISIDSIDQDTGISATDYITSDDTPTIHGRLSDNIDSSTRVELSFDGGTNWHTATVSGTNWSYSSAPLAEDTYTLIARTIDVAGNIGSTATQSITINLTAPTTMAIITHAVDDVGIITGDVFHGGSTDDTKPVLHGTLSAPAVSGEELRIYLGATLLGTVALTAGQTAWSYAISSDLANDTHALSARVVNIVDLESVGPIFNITINTVPLSVTSLTIDDLDTDTSWTSAFSITEDTSDFITRDTTISLKGAAVVGAGGIVQISSDGGTTWTGLNVVSGAWTYDDPIQRTSDTTYQLRVVDSAGNVSPTTVTRTVDIDVTAPSSGLLSPALRPLNDTGVIGDNITRDTSLLFTSADSGLKDANSTIVLIHDVNGNGIFEHGIDVILATDSNAGTSWSLSSSVSADTSYNLGLIQYDAAGNFSRLSPTVQIDIVSADDHKTGSFTATSSSTIYNYYTAGMGTGIGENGLLQFTVRESVLTQTGLTTSTRIDSDYRVGDVITNTTFFDYNRDGYADVVAGSYYYGDIAQSVFTGNNDGTFTHSRVPVSYTTALGGVIAFDKEGDGYLDVLWGDWGNDNLLPIFASNNAGVLVSSNLLASGNTIYSNKEASGVDLDNDGDIDIAIHSYIVNGAVNGYAMTTLINDGSGTFHVGQTVNNVFNNYIANADNAVSMTWADFDGDGDMDLFLGRTYGTNISGIYLNNNGTISSEKINIGDTSSAVSGGASIAVDWNGDGKMDVVEFSNSGVSSGVISLYTNTSTNGLLSFNAPQVTLASAIPYIGGANAVDYDWDGDIDIVYQMVRTGEVASIENTNQVADGTALHLRIVDQNGINSYYGNTVQLFDSRGKLVATQILNPQSGVGTNDSTGLVHFFNLSPDESYTVALVRSVSGASQDIGGVASLATGADTLSTIENVNKQWSGLKTGKAHNAYILSGESDVAINDGVFIGTGYNDTFFGTLGDDTFFGSGGWSNALAGDSAWSATGGLDIVDYGTANAGITADLGTGTATGQGNDTLIDIEGIRGSAHDDVLTGSAADNLFEGRGGNDTINLVGSGRDQIVYKMLDRDDATGGNGSDTITGFTVGDLATNNNADVIDLRDLLSGYKGTANIYYDIGEGAYVLDYASRGLLDYLNVTVAGGDTLIQVDLNGTGSFSTVATLSGVETTLEELLSGHQVWVSSSDNPVILVHVNALNTTDTTPIVTGALSQALGAGDVLQVVIDGVTYSSNALNEVVVDPVHNTWYVQVSGPLTPASYNVTATVRDTDGSLLGHKHSTGEVVVADTEVSAQFKGDSSANDKATALTIGEDGAWRVLSNGLIFDSTGSSHTSFGRYDSTQIRLPLVATQAATFVDYNRDGYMDILASDNTYGDGGQQAWHYDGSGYSDFQVGGSGNTSANTISWYGGIMAYDKVGDGYADIVYGDTAPNDAAAGGGYATTFVENHAGTFIKDRNFTYNTLGSPAPTNSGNSSPQKEMSGVDINNDGTVDIVFHGNTSSNYHDATKTTSSNNLYRLVVVNNVGDGTLYSSQVLDNVFYNYIGDRAYAPSMTWADFDGDGYMDLFLGRGRTSETGAVTNSDMSRILYNDHGTIVQSTTGDYATTYFGDSLRGGAS
ncbi:MAG: Ig-like domain-containing protein, partial [Micavibrio sp.]